MREYLKVLGFSFYLLLALLITSPYYFYSYKDFYSTNLKPFNSKNIQDELRKSFDEIKDTKLSNEEKHRLANETGAIMFPLLLALGLFLKGYYFIIIWNLLFATCLIGLSVTITFEAFRRYSKYGLSHNHRIFDHLISIMTIMIAFLSFFLGPNFLIPTLLIIGYSYFVSVDISTERKKIFYKRKYFSILMTTLVLFILTITNTFISKALINYDASKAPPIYKRTSNTP